MPYTAPDRARIQSMFAAIASKYDRANTILSGGVHHWWRREAVRYSGAAPGDRVLDCATGTGDLAIAFHQSTGSAIGTDFVAEMIDIARRKSSEIPFALADVTELPFADRSFDIASIGFGIRNVGDPYRAIAEMTRVLRPGGRLIVLEFGQPQAPLFGKVYDLYRTRILPALGGMLTGNREAYAYLDRSSARFPSGSAFLSLLGESGAFVALDYKPQTFGIAYLYRAVKR